MAETKYTGWVVKKTNYLVFDEVITFLTTDGRLISCISLGSRKINSKNGRNLFLANEVEFEIYESRTQDKLSKLKRVVTIKQMNWNCENFESFQLLHECVSTETPNYWNRVDFYKKYLATYFNELENDQYTILKILKDFSVLNGINMEVNKCVICGSTHLKTISFAEHGMLCNICFNNKKATYFSLEISKCIHYLFNDNANLKKYVEHFGFVIKLIKQYINDNLGINFISLKNY